MMLISTLVSLEAKGRMLRFLLLALVLLEATTSLAVGQAPQAKAALGLRARMEVMQPQAFGAPAAPAQLIDRMIFQPDQTPDAARQRLETSLSNEVDEIDRTCTLSPAQKHKLFLTGRGDIKRFFDRCEALRKKYVASENDGRNDIEINEDINSLQMTLGSGLFQGNSLLHKALPRALTGEQFALYDALMRDRLQSRHAAAIERTVTLLENRSPFTEAERDNFRAFLKKETRRTRIAGPYDFYDIIWQLGRLPEEKVKPLLNQTQWLRLQMYQNNFQRIEPALRKAGYLRDEDDEDEIPGAPMMAPKK